MAGTPRDSLYVLDVLYDRDGGRRPEMIVTDTTSYSDIVFGLLTLAGFAYAPQLADLPDQKMWRIDRTADYGASQDAARGRIDLARIVRHWEDILPIVGSIRTGAVRAYDVIRMSSGCLPRRPPHPAGRRDRPSRHGMEDQIGALGLVLHGLVLFNTRVRQHINVYPDKLQIRYWRTAA